MMKNNGRCEKGVISFLNSFNFFSFKVSQWTIIDIKHIKLLFINKEKKTYIVDKNNFSTYYLLNK